MMLRVMVPRWSIRPAKLLTRSPLALRLVAFLDFTEGEGSVAATGEDRSARCLEIGVVEQKGRQSSDQMPLNVVGEHAQIDRFH
jgi:hypothetical protein